MLKLPITYTDGNDEEVTEDFYFHLSQAELTEWEVEYEEGLATVLQNIIKSNNRKEILAIFKKLVLDAFGVKTPDGKGFEKSEELRRKFSNSFAYQQLFVDLASDDKKAAIFINGIVPKEMAEAMRQAELEQQTKAALTKVPPAEPEDAPSTPSA